MLILLMLNVNHKREGHIGLGSPDQVTKRNYDVTSNARTMGTRIEFTSHFCTLVQ